MTIGPLKGGKKMLTNKILYSSNISSNNVNFQTINSSVPNTLFELMKTNVLVVVDTKPVNVPCDNIVEVNKKESKE